MENITRRIFFWSLVAVFFVVAPTVVFYARGYRVDLKRGVVVHSGTITLKSNPETIIVRINDKIDDSKKLNRINSSYNINGLMPGSYSIQVDSPDFTSWSKKLDVHSGLSTEFWNVLLVRKNYQKTDIPAEGAEKFFVSPKDDLVVYTDEKDGNLTASVADITARSVDMIFEMTGWNFIDDERKENIEWSPDQDFISIPVRREVVEAPAKNSKATRSPFPNIPAKKTEYAYFVADIGSGALFNLNEFLGKIDIKDVRWDPRERGYLFLMDGTSLFRVNVADKNDLTLVQSGVTAYDISGSTVYYILESNNLVFKTSLDGLSERTQITSDFPEDDQIISRMIVFSEEEVAFTSDKGNFYVFNDGEHDKYFRKLGTGVIGSHFSNDGKKLLFWTPNEISCYFASDWKVQPFREENDLTNITRYSEPIRNVQWFKDFEHVIFSSGKYVKVIELDPRDRRNTQDLMTASIADPFVIYNGSLERLFFTDKPENSDHPIIQSIVFPEPTPILGLGG